MALSDTCPEHPFARFKSVDVTCPYQSATTTTIDLGHVAILLILRLIV